jgi:hypothetical protein
MIRLVRRAVFTLTTLRTELTRLRKRETHFLTTPGLSYSIQVQPAVTGHGPANGPTNPERCPRGQAVTHSKCAPVFDSCSAIGRVKQSTVLSADLPMKITQLPTVKLTQAPLFSDPDHSPEVQQLPVRPSEIAPVVRHSTLSPHAPSFYPRQATAVKVDQSADQRCTENHAIAAGIPNCQVIITADRAAADLTSSSLNDAMTDPDVWYDCPTDPESATVLSDTVLPARRRAAMNNTPLPSTCKTCKRRMLRNNIRHACSRLRDIQRKTTRCSEPPGY